MIMKVTQFCLMSLFLISVMGSCKEASPQQLEINTMHDEVMVIHDAVMPKMRDIYKLRKELKKEEENSTTTTLIKNLENADDAMMDWMAQYKKPGTSDENYQKYLNEQKASISVVRDEMLSAIQEAQEYLAK